MLTCGRIVVVVRLLLTPAIWGKGSLGPPVDTACTPVGAELGAGSLTREGHLVDRHHLAHSYDHLQDHLQVSVLRALLHCSYFAASIDIIFQPRYSSKPPKRKADRRPTWQSHRRRSRSTTSQVSRTASRPSGTPPLRYQMAVANDRSVSRAGLQTSRTPPTMRSPTT